MMEAESLDGACAPTATLIPISLTGVDRSGQAMGAAAGRLLLKCARGRFEAPNEVLTPPPGVGCTANAI